MNDTTLIKYFRKRSSIQEEKEIMDWVESSTDNKIHYDEARKRWNAILIHTGCDDLSSISLKKAQKTNLWKYAFIAASLTLFIIFSWSLFIPSKKYSFQTVVVPPGQRTEVILEDGTIVWLNSNSKLTYPTSFGNKKREVTLTGEGFFDVKKNKRIPFIVHTKKYDIRVLGTSFNVFSYENASQPFELSLLSGSVNIISYDPNNPQNLVISKNEIVMDLNGTLEKTQINDFERFRWKEGLICLDDVGMEEVISRLSVYYDVKIQIENPELKAYRCTGKFRQSDGIDYALKVLQKEWHFDYYRDENSNSIIVK